MDAPQGSWENEAPVLRLWTKTKNTAPLSDGSSAPESAAAVLNRNFGDLVYDLFHSVLWNHQGARVLHLRLWRTIDRRLQGGEAHPERHVRAWVLQEAVDLLLRSHRRLGRSLSPSEQVMLDANLNIPARLRQFEAYLHKLRAEEQILLLLRDKYGLPYAEIAAALRTPEGSLRVRHQQALRTLEEWLWDRA